VVVYTRRVHLCARALEVVTAAQLELGFELALVDIGATRRLEARYRERLARRRDRRRGGIHDTS